MKIRAKCYNCGNELEITKKDIFMDVYASKGCKFTGDIWKEREYKKRFFSKQFLQRWCGAKHILDEEIKTPHFKCPICNYKQELRSYTNQEILKKFKCHQIGIEKENWSTYNPIWEWN